MSEVKEVAVGKKRKVQKIEDVDEDTGCSTEDGKGVFRLNRQDVYLTYSQCPVHYDKIKKQLLRKGLPIVAFLGCMEEHQDGNLHSHMYLKFGKKVDIKDVRYFDIKGPEDKVYHPNIQRPKVVERVWDYIMKKCVYTTDINFHDHTITGFAQRQKDVEAFINYVKLKSRTPVPWPIKLPNGEDFDPRTLGNKRHLWIVGPPDCGKSTWWLNTFEGCRVYVRQQSKYPYDHYVDEEVIIFDDFFPSFAEIASVSSVVPSGIACPVYGHTRYHPRYWAPDVDKVMIVLSHRPPEYKSEQALVESRFNILNWEPVDASS
jgi:hypothetical protein